MALRSTFEHVCALKGQMTLQGSTQSCLASISVPTSERFTAIAIASKSELRDTGNGCFILFPQLSLAPANLMIAERVHR